jgi:hypothetical protein
MVSRLSALLIPVLLALVCSTAVQATTIMGAINATDQSAPPSAKFRITFAEKVDTQELLDGDPIEATIKEDLKINHQVVAPAGSEVVGHIELKMLERKHHDDKPKVRKKPLFMLRFDRIVTPDKREIPMAATVPQQFAVFNNGGAYRQITIGLDGELVKTQSLESYVVPELNLAIGKSLLQHGSPVVLSGDEVMIEATFPRLLVKKN